MRKSAIYILCILFLGLSNRISAQNDFEIVKNVDIFISILNELNDKYADEISPGELTQTAIKAMLNSLDPYTVYFPESDVENYRMLMTGDHSDVDVVIQLVNGKMVIAEITEDSPSAKAGLRVGDQILKVNTQSADNSTVEGIQIAMRGQPGSSYNHASEHPLLRHHRRKSGLHQAQPVP